MVKCKYNITPREPINCEKCGVSFTPCTDETKLCFSCAFPKQVELLDKLKKNPFFHENMKALEKWEKQVKKEKGVEE